MAKKIDPAVDKELKALQKQIHDLDKKYATAHNDQEKKFVGAHNDQEKSRAAGIDSLQKQIQDLDKKLVDAINARH